METDINSDGHQHVGHRGSHEMTSEKPKRTIRVVHGRDPRPEDPPREKKRAKMGGRVIKRAKFWAPHPSGLHPSGSSPSAPLRGPYPSETPLFLATFSGFGPPTLRGFTLLGPLWAPILREHYFFWFLGQTPIECVFETAIG